VVELPLFVDRPAAQNRQIMDIRWRIRSRPNARRAVVTLVGGIAEETVKREKSAPTMRRRLLSIDLLKTNDVGRKIIQDRPENGYPTCEFHFVRSRPIKIFEIKCRNAKRNGHHQIITILSANANGAYGARTKKECSQAISWRLKKERPDGDPVLATVIRRGQRLFRGEPDLAGIRNRAAAWLPAPLRRLGTYVHPEAVSRPFSALVLSSRIGTS